jgi:hypothetical protein
MEFHRLFDSGDRTLPTAKNDRPSDAWFKRSQML